MSPLGCYCLLRLILMHDLLRHWVVHNYWLRRRFINSHGCDHWDVSDSSLFFFTWRNKSTELMLSVSDCCLGSVLADMWRDNGQMNLPLLKIPISTSVLEFVNIFTSSTFKGECFGLQCFSHRIHLAEVSRSVG